MPEIFTSIANLASFLDTNCHTWNAIHDRDLTAELKEATAPSEIAPAVQYERIALGIWFKECTAEREFSATTTEGQTVGSPLPNDLGSDALSYYQQRFDQTTNPFLKARYGLILWNAPKPIKSGRYAIAALDSLLAALNQADCISGRRDCLDILRQACAISTRFRHREADTAAAALDRFTGAVPYEQEGRAHIFTLITEQAQLFRAHDPAGTILPTVVSLFEERFAAADYHTCEHLCKLAAPFAQGSQLPPREWHQRLGQTYEALAAQRLSDDSSLMPIEFLTRAANAYQLSGDQAAETRSLEQAQALKDKLRLGVVTSEFTPEQSQMLADDIKRHTEAVLAVDADEVCRYLAFSPRAIPDFADMKQKAAQERQPSFLDLVPTVYIDENRNTSHEPSGADEEERNLRYAKQMYSLGLQLQLQYTGRLFVEGYRQGKFTFETVRSYLEQHSWFAQPLPESDFSGNTVEYAWAPLILPGLENFFQQLGKVANGSGQPDFVLCLDSLTPKMEGLLRELLQRSGASTITARQRDLREVAFDGLLDLAQEKDLLDENECYFIRYVCLSEGKNVRNNVAHAYYHHLHQYSIEKAVLMVLVLLRLSHFHFGPVAAEATPDSAGDAASSEPGL
ncbi:hypothetical protein [Hymenobacter armeniacus]|uniref:DUF4209 domain-containing protein n=1 Tax=Hymenobacter armeniacus TaxID=2771358 RepID=A0ABR8JQE6_9BACT|nr:hypothetical protein [Hymenobacter armeniacus]MBD2722196.1 hypothetical protein [Hymenobacter armeniacus]